MIKEISLALSPERNKYTEYLQGAFKIDAGLKRNGRLQDLCGQQRTTSKDRNSLQRNLNAPHKNGLMFYTTIFVTPI